MMADWRLTDCWLTTDWLLTYCWLTADWLLTDCLKIWARKMKIVCSRQVWTERTNEQRLAFIELLSEPKKGKWILAIWLSSSRHRESITYLCDEWGVASEVILPHGIVFLHGPFRESLLGLGLVLGQLGVPRVLAWGRKRSGKAKNRVR